MYDAADLRRRAERCFRLARGAFDRDVAEKFAALGRDYLQKAAALDPAFAAGACGSQPRRAQRCARSRRPLSTAHPPAVDVDGLAGDEGGIVAGEE
jgi:hypothetical protein